MSTFDLPLSPQTYRWRFLALRPLAASWTLSMRWIERSLQRKALADLDEHMLRDIGITRYDAVRECRKPFWK